MIRREEWINKKVLVPYDGILRVLKKEADSDTCRGSRNFEGIRLNEMSQSPKARYHMCPLTRSLSCRQIHGDRGRVGFSAAGEEEGVSVVGHGVSVCKLGSPAHGGLVALPGCSA